jgi:proteasome lid subunit RPN8/RPN11
MGVEISRGVLQRILALAVSEPEREVCGLLLTSSQRIEAVRETANVSESRTDSFEIDPAALFATLRAERAGGPRLIGHYHSHPNGLTTPSARDAMMATSPGRLWLIVASGEARLWREVPGGAVRGAFEPVELLPDSADEGCA